MFLQNTSLLQQSLGYAGNNGLIFLLAEVFQIDRYIKSYIMNAKLFAHSVSFGKMDVRKQNDIAFSSLSKMQA